jgi:hypothetical protein
MVALQSEGHQLERKLRGWTAFLSEDMNSHQSSSHHNKVEFLKEEIESQKVTLFHWYVIILTCSQYKIIEL